MAIEVGIDFALLAIIFLGVGIALAVEYLALGAARVVPSEIPVIGSAWHWLWGEVSNLAKDAEVALLHAAGNVWASFLNNISQVGQLLFALGVLIGDAAYQGLAYLWNTSLPALLKATLKPIRSEISAARSVANTAESDAQTALSKIGHVADVTIPNAITTAEGDAAKLATAAKNAAISYADAAVAKLKAAEDAAVAQAVQLAATAEADAAAAVKSAEAYARSLVAPIPGEIAAGVGEAEAAAGAALAPVASDLSQLEQYIKGLGLAGIVAAVPALSALLTQVLTDTGLSNEECRGKVKGICGTDPNVWGNLLGLLAAVGIGFDFRELVKVANDIAPEAAAIVKSAA